MDFTIEIPQDAGDIPIRLVRANAGQSQAGALEYDPWTQDAAMVAAESSPVPLFGAPLYRRPGDKEPPHLVARDHAGIE